MWRWFKWVLLVLGIGVAIFIFAAVKGILHDRELSSQDKGGATSDKSKKDEFAWPDPHAKTITAVPLDLSQIEAISKFRSCAGHDRAGYDFEQILETDRSMKHYLEPAEEFKGTRDKIKLLAPFEGTIVRTQHEEINPDGTAKTIQENRLLKDGGIEHGQVQEARDSGGRTYSGDDFDLMSPLDQSAIFGFRHVVVARNWQVGDQFKAGDLIGYASLGQKENDFDLDYVGRNFKFEEGDKSIEVLDTMFNHMTDSVLAEFARYGLTPQNTSFTKAERDANPCGYDPVTKYGSTVCQKSSSGPSPIENDCFVQIKRP